MSYVIDVTLNGKHFPPLLTAPHLQHGKHRCCSPRFSNSFPKLMGMK